MPLHFVVGAPVSRVLAAFAALLASLLCSLVFFLAFGLLLPRFICGVAFGPDPSDWGPGDGAGILGASLVLSAGISILGLPVLAICLYEWWSGKLRVRSNNRWRGP
jgi:hypothetical protein